jgi:hypothetical protein
MTDESTNLGVPAACGASNAPSLPAAVDRATFQVEPTRPRSSPPRITEVSSGQVGSTRALIQLAVS